MFRKGILPLPLIVLIGVSLGGGCQTGTPPEQPPKEGFGDAYEILSARSPADPDLSPALDGDTLFALIAYSGGCRDHAFDLQYRILPDTSQLWLYHDADGDDCEAYLSDEVRLPVPGEALGPPTIVLLNPQGGPPYVLRWDMPP